MLLLTIPSLIVAFLSLIAPSHSSEQVSSDAVINLAVVACGDRANETLNLLKSALMFTKAPLKFYVITEPELKKQFKSQFEQWPEFIQKKFTYSLMNTRFPAEYSEEWRQLFKLCASQRMFLPNILKTVDSLIYVDTDVLLLTDLADLWSHFNKFNSTQLAALAPEHEEANMGWYNRFARHPYYGKLGLNSGVMLMNLTRMREFKFVEKVLPLYREYKYNITWGDQCLLNILFHFYPERLYVYGCSWNYRPDHCMYGSNCKEAEEEGAHVLHGSRRVFHNEKEPAFKAVYELIDQYNFNETTVKVLYENLKKSFTVYPILETYCGKAKKVFFKSIKTQLKNHKQIVKEAKCKYDNSVNNAESQIHKKEL